MPEDPTTSLLASSALATLPAAVRASVLAEGVPIEVGAGTVLFRPGDGCSHYLLLLAGTVRVQLVTESGHEILLYRVDPGESCVLTTSCLLAHEAYAAEGVAETAVRGVGLPAAAFDRLLATSAEFRSFVFASFGQRLSDLMLLLNEVAFRRIDARLANWLLQRGAEGGPIQATHQAIAAELGTAREVVSRQLKSYERRGLVRLARGVIDLLDRRGLADLAAMADRGSGR